MKNAYPLRGRIVIKTFSDEKKIFIYLEKYTIFFIVSRSFLCFILYLLLHLKNEENTLFTLIQNKNVTNN